MTRIPPSGPSAVAIAAISSLPSSLELKEDIAALESELGTSLDHDEGVRFVHRARIDKLVENAIGKKPFSTICERFKAAGVCFGPYQTLHQAVASDSVFSEENPVLGIVAHPSGHAYMTPGYPASFSSDFRAPPRAAPRLGENTESVLSSILGLTGANLAALHDRGVIQL